MKKNNLTWGFKVFNPDWTCRGFQYEVGKSYFHQGEIELCFAGFHFCKSLHQCFNYYEFDPSNKVAEVEAWGRVFIGSDNMVSNNIRIVKELTWNEVFDRLNSGRGNSGRMNAGSGNAGYGNSGDRNAGGYNAGNMNAGHLNTGHFNAGKRNTGNSNVGCFNAGNNNVGFFNTGSPFITSFNKPTTLTMEEYEALPGYKYLTALLDMPCHWVVDVDMTTRERYAAPQYAVDGGYLSCGNHKVSNQFIWDIILPPLARENILALPNFDPAIFKEITGIDVNAPMKKGNSV